ncbi:MAG: alpha/beta hydrolase [Lachnospiraceae bacterium]|nr:alpha/beta hydrolase [Robinsoniella sp.]MDY3765889.1 alpha/beta hydrolase [Lachnospiraceae bacterium]
MKKQKRNILVSAAILAAFAVTATGYASESAPQQQQEEQSEEATAKRYVELLGEQAYEELMTQFSYTEEMDALVKDGSLEKSYQSLMRLLGEMKETKTPFVIEQYGYLTVCVPCQFEVQSINLQISFLDGKIAGVLTAQYQEAEPETEKEANFTEQEISLSIGDGMELPGTLTLPEGDGPFPLVILVHGSGPNDRDETLLGNKPFQDIAEGLAQKGIASYRYDKRTYVYQKELASDKTLTVQEETVNDAVCAVQQIGSVDVIDKDQIFVAGHSLGGYLIPQIDDQLQEGQAAGYLFLAAPVKGMAQLMEEQYDFLFGLEASPSDAIKQQKEWIDAELEKLHHLDQYGDEEVIMGAYVTYWRDLETYDIAQEAVKIEEPCLILQGEEDYQVTMEEFTSWQKIFAEKENAKFVSFPGLTHLFMEGKKENGPSDYEKLQHVSQEVIDQIAEFVSEERGTEQND